MVQLALAPEWLDLSVERVGGLLSSHEQKCVAPRVSAVVEVMYADPEYWDQVANSKDSKAVFVTDDAVAGVVSLLSRQRQGLVTLCSSVDDAIMLLVALDKQDMAAVLRSHWRLHLARLMYAALKQQLPLASDASEIPNNVAQMYSELNKEVGNLSSILCAQDLKGSFDRFAKLGSDTVMGATVVCHGHRVGFARQSYTPPPSM